MTRIEGIAELHRRVKPAVERMDAFDWQRIVTDLDQQGNAVVERQLAKKHSDKLRPRAKALRGAFGPVLLNQGRELRTRKMVEQLIEQAGSLYDCLGPPCGRRSAKLPARKTFANVQL